MARGSKRPVWALPLRGASLCYGVCFVSLRISHAVELTGEPSRTKTNMLEYFMCTDQFLVLYCMHKRRSNPNTSTFLNMKETTAKSSLLRLGIMIMQSRSSLNKQSPAVSCWPHSGRPHLSCALVMTLHPRG